MSSFPHIKAEQNSRKKVIQANPVAEKPNEELEATVWGRFVVFCNKSYEQFVPNSPRIRQQQNKISEIHRKCAKNLRKYNDENWEEFLSKHFSQNELPTARNFYSYASKRKIESPEQLLENVTSNLKKFIELASYAFISQEADKAERDLLKIGEFNDVIDYFSHSSEKIFILLSFLPDYLDNENKQIILNSQGYKEIIDWGASQFLKNFCFQLQKRFSITRTAMKDETAQVLLRDFGEIEVNLKNQIFLLEEENQELKNNLEDLKTEAFQDAVYALAKSLQTQAQPVLDQIFDLSQLLNKLNEEGTALSKTDSLRCLITLECLLKAFKDINIKQFPGSIKKSFELTSEDLNNYFYVKGEPFANPDEKKLVRCVSLGWKVGEKIVTPARVEEIAQES